MKTKVTGTGFDTGFDTLSGTLFIHNFSTEGLKYDYKLRKPNKRGWGCVYLHLRIAGKRYRFSTGIKVHHDFWIPRMGICIPSMASATDIIFHKEIKKYLGKLKDLVFQNIFYSTLVSEIYCQIIFA